MKRGERIAEIPPDYCGVWNYNNITTKTIPWEPLTSFLAWLGQKPHVFQCVNEEVGIAIIKRVMAFNWTAIGWERFWYVHTPTRIRETYMDFGDVENNIEEALTTIRTVMFTDIDRVEVRFQERLLNVLLARKRANKITLFSTFKNLSSLSPDLQDLLTEAVTAE